MPQVEPREKKIPTWQLWFLSELNESLLKEKNGEVCKNLDLSAAIYELTGDNPEDVVIRIKEWSNQKKMRAKSLSPFKKTSRFNWTLKPQRKWNQTSVGSCGTS